MDLRRIEEVSLNSWPALQQMLFDGWLLRFAKGYTKRANSVNPLYGSTMDVEEKVEVCERVYAERGLPIVFRLTPFSSPPNLDAVLDRRDYARIDPTLVEYLDLEGYAAPPAPAAELREEGLDDWMDIFRRITNFPAERQQAHREILEAIPGRRFLATARNRERYKEQAVACGLGVLEGAYFGLFDIFTDLEQRNRGYGTGLVAGMLEWAKRNGARHAYLQVTRENLGARRLYGRLGFGEVYGYWYRVGRK